MAARSGLGVTGFMNAAFGFRAVFFAALGAAFLAPLVAVFFAAAFPLVLVFLAVLAICSPLVDCSTHVRFAAQNNTARARLRSGNAGFVRGNARYDTTRGPRRRRTRAPARRPMSRWPGRWH